MKKIFVLLLLSGLSAVAQPKKKTTAEYEAVYMEAGLLVPVGTLREIIKPSAGLGFWYKNRLNRAESVDFGFSFFAPDTYKPFYYMKKDSLFSNRPKGPSGMIGLRYCRRIDFSERDKCSLEWVSTIGYAFLAHRSTYVPGEGEKSEHRSLVLSTVSLEQGLRFNYENLGLQLNYQYTPYGLFYDYIGKEAGAHSVTLSLIYRQ